MKHLTTIICILATSMIYGQSSRVEFETDAPSGEERFQLDLRNNSNGNASASVFRMFAGTDANMVESGIRNFPNSYDAVTGYGGYMTLSNATKGIIFRADQGNSDMRFLLGGFPIQDHQKMILTSVGNLGVGANDPAARVQIKGGDVYLEDVGSGVIMKSPDGSCWRLTVTDLGDPDFEKLMNCPGIVPAKSADQ
ncbi:MAG: hypothetical protein HKN76_02005 [Saprospiraceae bacterium]|nr:hypothetical protein [Saprospiraceae bacterium]